MIPALDLAIALFSLVSRVAIVGETLTTGLRNRIVARRWSRGVYDDGILDELFRDNERRNGI